MDIEQAKQILSDLKYQPQQILDARDTVLNTLRLQQELIDNISAPGIIGRILDLQAEKDELERGLGDLLILAAMDHNHIGVKNTNELVDILYQKIQELIRNQKIPED